ncbi:hypothetical protein NIES4071_69180 [Calothrix sp. NIES-4071]|nr:hypothetical protein NIES4071_69180 [Calothrix sp. NIES-4071]BAZ61195.1 hypothetical protein NIES4105_69130 [Calothrix sp. NIES-4105]
MKKIEDGNRENVRNTSFGDCVSKIQFLINLLLEPEQGILQAIAVIQDIELYNEGERLRAIAIESICNAPWNLISQTQAKTRKGGLRY